MRESNLETDLPSIKKLRAAKSRAGAQLAELIVEYAPHPPFGTGTAKSAAPELVDALST